MDERDPEKILHETHLTIAETREILEWLRNQKERDKAAIERLRAVVRNIKKDQRRPLDES